MTIMTNRISGLSASNAAYRSMSAADSLTHYTGNSKNLQLGMLNDNLIYKASLAMEDSQKNLAHSKTKRKLDVIA